MKRFHISRFFALLMVICLLATTFMSPASAASWEDATIRMDNKCSLTVYKYDFTNAAADGIWSQDSYVSTGDFVPDVVETLGDNYAVAGVEFTYLKVADIFQFSARSANSNENQIHLLYKFDKTKSADLLAAIGLENGKDSFESVSLPNDNSWYYQSDALNQAFSAALTKNATTVKNALESYIKAHNGTAMDLTDEEGCSEATDLAVGLYLVVETKVPEQVTNTTNPFFVSLPTTTANNVTTFSGINVTFAGIAWNYDVVVYPKNETGSVTLLKEVRESKQDGGKNNGTSSIEDGFSDNATASAGDLVEYQIISTLPTITSSATSIAEYTFKDILCRGLTYDSNVPLKIEWFTDADCTDLVETWEAEDEMFTVKVDDAADGSHTMTIAMTEKGLAKINAANTDAENTNGSLYAGYSNYTLRISYAARLNADESFVYGEAGNPNEVTLTWRRTSESFIGTLKDDSHVYSYGIDLTKKFSDGKTAQELFNDVHFKLQNKTDGMFAIAELNNDEGVWYVTGFTAEEAKATSMHPVMWQEKPGHLVIKGLEDDEYVMTEVMTAESYNLLKEAICIEIFAEEDADRVCSYGHELLTASAKVDGVAVSMLSDEQDTNSSNALVPLTVVNTRGFSLPITGDSSMQFITICGVVMLISGIVLGVMILAKKKKADKE